MRIANAGLVDIASKPITLKSDIANKYSLLLDNVEHYHIQEYGTKFIEMNGWINISSSVPSRVFSSINYQLVNKKIWSLLKGSAFKINLK